MNITTANILCEITSAFYRKNADAFAATRKSPWQGWTRCLQLIRRDQESLPGDRISQKTTDKATSETELGQQIKPKQKTLKVLDLACGNLRFENFLLRESPQTSFIVYAVDNCDALALSAETARMQSQIAPEERLHLRYQHLDVLDALRQGTPSGAGLTGALDAPACDLTVCFGFMHHIPLAAWREELLSVLLQRTKPGGYLIVSFWQFLNNTQMAARAQTTHQQALQELAGRGITANKMDAGDLLLGWNNTPGQYRYCHSFSATELDALEESVASSSVQVARFVADGRTNDLNSYLLLRKR